MNQAKSKRMRVFRLLSLLALPLLIDGCHPRNDGVRTEKTAFLVQPPVPRHEFVYVATDTGLIYQYYLAANNQLRLLMPATVRIAKSPVVVAADPGGDYLYVAAIGQLRGKKGYGSLASYQIGLDGRLHTTNARQETAQAIFGLAVDPKGRFLYASGEHGAVLVYYCHNNGALTPLGTTKTVARFGFNFDPLNGLMTAGIVSDGGISFDPAGRFAFVSYNSGFVDHREYRLAAYKVQPNGSFHFIANVKPVTGNTSSGQVGSFTVSPDGNRAYLTIWNTEDQTHDGIWQYGIAQDGTLTLLPNPVQGMDWEDSVIEPHNRFFIIASYDRHLLVSRIGKDGVLSPPAVQADAPGQDTMEQIAIDQTGSFLYVTTAETLLSTYRLMTDGMLVSVAAPRKIQGHTESLVVIQRKN